MKSTIFVVVLLTLAGCGTIHSVQEGRFGVYSGVRQDVRYIRYRAFLDFSAGGWFDLPVSFVHDTALLPLTFPVSLVRLITEGGPWGKTE